MTCPKLLKTLPRPHGMVFGWFWNVSGEPKRVIPIRTSSKNHCQAKGVQDAPNTRPSRLANGSQTPQDGEKPIPRRRQDGSQSPPRRIQDAFKLDIVSKTPSHLQGASMTLQGAFQNAPINRCFCVRFLPNSLQSTHPSTLLSFGDFFRRSLGPRRFFPPLSWSNTVQNPFTIEFQTPSIAN